jgi:hypothetical protein
MNGLLHFVERHWLSIVLIAGALLSVYLVYKDRSKLMMRDDN